MSSQNPGKPYRRGRLSTVNLLVLTSLDQLIFKLKILFTFFTKQATLMRRSTVLSLPLQLVFPDDTDTCGLYYKHLLIITSDVCTRESLLKGKDQYD